MGATPSRATDPQREELNAKRNELIQRAADAIAAADVLLVCTGAGFSADSGLAVYKDVANVPAYHEKQCTYHDLCDPGNLFETEPELWYGFWGSCFNDYRDTEPHAGYKLIASWRDRFVRKKKFFSLTSNVDAHWLTSGACSVNELHECHGNLERWQCADAACAREQRAHWPAPSSFRFAVDECSRLAADGSPAALPDDVDKRPSEADGAGSFKTNWPRCGTCGGLARPNVLMFNDRAWVANTESKDRFDKWREEVIELAKKSPSGGREDQERLAVTILEIGAGDNVTTIRQKSESFARDVADAGGAATLLRVNPEFPLADSADTRSLTLPLLLRGLETIKLIDAALPNALEVRPHKSSPLEGLTFDTIDTSNDRDNEGGYDTAVNDGGTRALTDAQRKGLDNFRKPSAKLVALQFATKRSEALRGGSSNAVAEIADTRQKAEMTQQKCETLLAELAETRAKFEKFDKLGDQLTSGLGKALQSLAAAEAGNRVKAQQQQLDSVEEEI